MTFVALEFSRRTGRNRPLHERVTVDRCERPKFGNLDSDVSNLARPTIHTIGKTSPCRVHDRMELARGQHPHARHNSGFLRKNGPESWTLTEADRCNWEERYAPGGSHEKLAKQSMLEQASAAPRSSTPPKVEPVPAMAIDGAAIAASIVVRPPPQPQMPEPASKPGATQLFSPSTPPAESKTRSRLSGGPIRMVSHYTGQRESKRVPAGITQPTQFTTYAQPVAYRGNPITQGGMRYGGAWQSITPSA